LLPSADHAAITGPRLVDEHDVQADVHAVADQLAQSVPVNSSTGGCERNALDATALDTLEDAAVDVSVQAEVVGVYKQPAVTGHGGCRPSASLLPYCSLERPADIPAYWQCTRPRRYDSVRPVAGRRTSL